MTQTTPVEAVLSNHELFAWGAFGGLAGFLLANALPYGAGLMAGDRDIPRPTIQQLAGVLIVVLINSFMGGVAALIVGEANFIRQAIVFGLSWPTILKAGGETLVQLADARQGKAPEDPAS